MRTAGIPADKASISSLPDWRLRPSQCNPLFSKQGDTDGNRKPDF
jgi:hypothetical protein